jgi:hypothetical protein
VSAVVGEPARLGANVVAPPSISQSAATTGPATQTAMSAPSAGDLDGKWHGKGPNGWQIDAIVQDGKMSGSASCLGTTYRFKAAIGHAPDSETWGTRIGTGGGGGNGGGTGLVGPPTIQMKLAFPTIQVMASARETGNGCAGEPLHLVRE